LVRALKPVSVSLLLALGFFIQFHFLANYPQPMLFGDPAAYYRVGVIFRDAFIELRAGRPPEEILETVRPYIYLVGVGSIYGSLEALRGQIRSLVSGFEGDSSLKEIEWLKPVPFFRLAFAFINTAGMLGCFLLARELAGWPAGLLALGGSVVYPSFALQTGRIFPEPIFCLFFVASTFCYVRAVRTEGRAWMAAAGLLLSAGFFFRAQLMNFFPFFVGAAFAVSLPFWIRSKRSRLALTLVLSVLPSMVVWGLLSRVASEDFSELEKFGFFTFPQQQRYPYGFWMLLDTDGWLVYQLKQDPFYLAMAKEAVSDPDLMRSRRRQYGFTLRYVASRARESMLLVLDNVYRLYDRPANNFQWDYPFSRRHQSLYQKAIVLLAVTGMVAFAVESLPLAGLAFVPLTLAALFGLSTPQPRYGQPAVFVFIAVAAAFVVSIAARWPLFREYGRRGRAWFGGLAALGVLLLAVGELLRMPLPEAGRWARAAGTLALMGLPFVLAGIGFARSRRHAVALMGVWAALGGIVAAHLARDRSWHEIAIELGERTPTVEQEILLSAESLGKLRTGTQAFILFDVHAAAGTLEATTVEVDGKTFPGSEIFPAMPNMGESTTIGGRNPRRYRQWWAFPLGNDLIPRSAPTTLRIRLTASGREPIRLYGDRFDGQDRVYDGPSFGNWPRVSAQKMEYDGDYRLPVTEPLASEGTRSFLVDKKGNRTPFNGVLRLRVVTLTSNLARYEWESDTGPAPGLRSALAFFGYSNGSKPADLWVEANRAVSFPLGKKEDFEVSRPPYRLCHRAEHREGGNAYGGYVLEVPAGPHARPFSLTVVMLSGMSLEPLFFSVDGERSPSDLRALAADCGVSPDVALVNGFSRILDASQNSYPTDTGRWSTKNVF
jgi:4-amino-4-deoxy-L-arabinose transferase-like glycosyltransferase